jgi:hypothetical protein
MSTNVRKSVTTIIICLVVITIAAVMARLIETDFGKVAVSNISISDPDGNIIVARLYRPVNATADHKLPAVINIHGYQNDKLADDSYSIELSRRGFVVVAPDVIGHGDSGGGLESGKLGTDPTYTGSTESVYLYVKTLPYVDAKNIGVMGHSMGAILAMILGMTNPEINASNMQCGLAGAPTMRNVLLTQSRYDEFALFREGLLTVDTLPTNKTRMDAFGLTVPVEWDKTYGNFADGTARRAELIQMEHHLQPLQNKAVAAGVSWMNQALQGGAPILDPTNQVFMWKELFGLITLLTALFMLLPLTNLLLSFPFFAPVAQPMPNRYAASKGNWWLFATINTIIGGVTYPILTQFGALSDKVEAVLPWFKMQVGNGVFLWFVVNIIICAVLFTIWYRGAHKKQNVTMYDMGVSFDKEKTVFDWNILGKTFLLGAILFATLYILEGIFQFTLGQEFRFVWPYMRQFSDPQRVGLFVLYLIPAFIFFLVNGGLFLFGQIRQPEESTPNKTQWIWWLKVIFAFLTGLFVVWMIQYIPWYVFNLGPGFELLGLPQFSAMWPLMLQVYIPEFMILLFLHTWFYRRTGRIYLGALMVSSMMIWFLAAGTIIAK